MITVNTLGTFQMTDGESVINDSNLHSIMLTKLLMYMILYRDKDLTTEDIGNAIWQMDASENPTGALKNLMYRLRKTLSKNFGDIEFIITDRGAYHWNPDVKVNLDIEQFELLINEAKFDNNGEGAIRKYEQALAMYQGEFMSKLLDMPWIVTQNSYYHSIYLSAVKALALLYKEHNKYEELEVLCLNALQYEKSDEQLYCYQIEARMRSGKINLALESYESARNIMEKELGIRKTTILNKVYEELLSTSKGQTIYKMQEIHDDIVEEDPQGVFMCGYPVFKEIYHLEARKSIRFDTPENLLLLTLICKDGSIDSVTDYRVNQAMTAMEQTLKECLRVGDVAAKYSDSQYIILLPTCTFYLANLVANRITSKFYKKYPKYKYIKIKCNVEEVSSTSKIVD